MELLDDELPQVPITEGGTPGAPGAAEVSFNDTIDASAYDSVPKMGDPLPAGTRRFRLKQYQMKLSDDGQPFFSVYWACQEEPLTGRIVFDNIPWVLEQDVKDAANPANPRSGEARKILNDRLIRSKAVMEAAGFKPSGSFGFKAFLDQNPELILQYNVSERKAKNAKGEWVGTGEMGNKVQKYLPLHRPA